MQTYHIISSKNKWCVKKQGATKALRVFKYRELVFGWAMVNLEMNDTVIVHNKNASVEFQIMPHELHRNKDFIDTILSWSHIEFTLDPSTTYNDHHDREIYEFKYNPSITEETITKSQNAVKKFISTQNINN